MATLVRMSAARERSSGGEAYLFPRHPSEVDRLHVQHHALREAPGAKYLAPRWPMARSRAEPHSPQGHGAVILTFLGQESASAHRKPLGKAPLAHMDMDREDR
jgi:hypothetical protein